MGIKKVDTIWLDGTLVNWDEATEHVLAHTLHYGLGAFEGIRVYERADGRSAVFRLDEHIDRLFASCHIATIDVPYSREQIKAACLEVLRANQLKSAYVRPLVYLGAGALGLGSLEVPTRTLIAAFEWGAYLGEAGLKQGIRVKISGFRRAGVDSFMSKGKLCGQYVTNILAKRDAIKSGYDEAIMLGADGLVAEGTGENVFVVRGNVIRTPPTTAAILDGITRDTAITLARELGYEVREQSVTRDELWTADEVFLTGTAAELTPVREVDDRRVGKGEPGPVTRRLQDHFFAVVKGDDRDHDHWFTFL
jgi:branched-chain amino acid aminotransferase